MSRRQVTLYDVLGLPMDATEDAIRRAYKRQLGRFHPATHQSTDNDSFVFLTADEEAMATAVSKLVEKAYFVLANPALRARYDRQLLGGRPLKTPAGTMTTRGRRLSATMGGGGSGGVEGGERSLSAVLSSPATRRRAAAAESPPPSPEDIDESYTTADGGRVRVTRRTTVDPSGQRATRYEAYTYTRGENGNNNDSNNSHGGGGTGGADRPAAAELERPLTATTAPTTPSSPSKATTTAAAAVEGARVAPDDGAALLLAELPRRMRRLIEQVAAADATPTTIIIAGL